MKQLRLNEIENALNNAGLGVGISVDGNRFYFNTGIYWGSINESEYDLAEENIKAFIRTRRGYTITLACDISGFAYWMIQQEEENYCELTIEITSETLTQKQVNDLILDIQSVISKFETGLPGISFTF